MLVRLAPALALLCISAFAQSVGDYQAAARRLTLDPSDCYRVRDLFLEREEAKFYFTDGLLIFPEPVLGRDVGAFFLAEDQSDSAEVVLIPPSRQERYSMAAFTGDGVLNRRFNHAVLLFTDDTADVLRAAVDERGLEPVEPAVGERVSNRWTPVFRNLLRNAELRIAVDLFSDSPKEDGFFAAAIGGLGSRFDVIVEPRNKFEQLSVGQGVRTEGEAFVEVWSRFPARSIRTGRRSPVPFGGSFLSYDLDVHLGEDLAASIIAKSRFSVDEPNRRTFAFGLSGRLAIQEVLVNDAPAEFLQERKAIALPSDPDYGTALVILPQAPDVGEVLEIEFRYSGAVVDHADNDVYRVSSRTSWYPRGEFEPSDYRMSFSYPARLDLRATGSLVSLEGDDTRRTAVYETQQPIRLAGFNLGSFVVEERVVGGSTLEVLANRELEARLQPQEGYTTAPALPPPPGGGARGGTPQRSMILRTSPGETSTPLEQIEEVADEVARAFTYFRDRFGPPVSDHISVTPIPGAAGQGFPGLVYAPTLSYLDPAKPPLATLSERQIAFYREVLFPHEISHQWWGNLVAVGEVSEAWLMEALATYSALLFIEEEHGPDARDRILRFYLEDLLLKNDDGDQVESAGPIVLGERLSSSRFPNAMALIVYGKGAWVMHMLRDRLGDEAFTTLLRDLSEKFAGRELSTEDFREVAAGFLAPDAADGDLREFFDQWVYGVGIPRLDVKWSQDNGRVTGVVNQRGVPDYFSAPIALEVRTAQGNVRTLVNTDGPSTEFSVAVGGRATGVVLDPDFDLLAVIDR